MSSNAVSELGGRELTRWFWRQLTSMRTALMLLLLLAIAAVPGSLVPQRGVDAQAVETYFLEHPKSAPILDDLGFFSVYSSPWFSAVYLLLMVSLVGCILPRAFVYYRALRARPPKAPRNFSRLPASASFETDSSPDEVVAAARRALGRSRIDVVDRDGVREVSAEKGFLREAGNLLFHVSIVVVLIGVAVGTLFGYRGSVIVTDGGGQFANSLPQYDEFSSGTLFHTDDLPPFSLTLDKVTAKFQPFGSPQAGAPREFRATGTYSAKPGDDPKPFDIEVNHPLAIGNTSVYLLGQGYAPVFKITDANGDVVYNDAVPFLPADATYTSNGIIKVPDAQPEQLGFQGFFIPTAVTQNGKDLSTSAHPAAANPLVGLNVWHGDLGLDDGTSQSVFTLDKSKMQQYTVGDQNFRVSLQPGMTADLPDGGTIEFTELRQFARFQIGSSPLVKVPLFGIIAGLIGLMASLTIKPRRTWIRTRQDGSRTVVEVAVLDRVPRDDLPADLDDFLERFKDQLGHTEEKKLV
ncbi:cytochrome c biogenesis protein ResB [Aeromicrobium wangtongii]|uniref:Cytochrome c biogenesis protein ResB n=1 Tax=Aeromicrobium wangtongii TaxID=2969247 RepID=A0ABY5M669_9ACTN|nr:cytochrome c biogenesis protein ResB [Aeromicrobium wangtongii]MCD9200054.1 cytochrome c biogenesis protein ResB [Aeromicrobium wangtongii]UUP13312.1 cytochrome c biogenesis protein ResB [Aeromicrobium wangtongii]